MSSLSTMNIPTAEALLPVATSIVNTMGTILTNMLGKTSPPLNDSVDLVRIHKYKILLYVQIVHDT